MKLKKFRVSQFRNVHDSGWVDLEKTTALVGRNESGKTNLLTALGALGLSGTGAIFTRERDFPADLMRSEFSEDLQVIRTRWLLSADEQSELATLAPEAAAAPFVEIARGYSGAPQVVIGNASSSDPATGAKEIASRLQASLGDAAKGDDGLEMAMDALIARAGENVKDTETWARGLSAALEAFDAARAGATIELSAEGRDARTELAELADREASSGDGSAAAARWVLDRLPNFIHVDEVPDIEGKMDLREFARRQKEGSSDPGDLQFALLLRMAGVDEALLDELLSSEIEIRRQIVGQMGALVTRRIRAVWSDRPLKVRFYLDGDQLNTLICEPTAFSDVEVNLNQRSKGFRWFFSFCVIVTASQSGVDDRGMMLLLDEPGLHLHPVGQRDLIQFLCGIEAPAVLTTQAWSLLPSGPDTSVLSVRYDLEHGSRVTDGPIDLAPHAQEASEPGGPAAAPMQQADPGDTVPAQAAAVATDTPTESASSSVDDDEDAMSVLFETDDDDSDAPATAPLPAVPALTIENAAAEMMGALLGEGPVLLVENLSDLWYLRAASDHLIGQGRTGLPDRMVPVPVGKAAYLGLVAQLCESRGDAPVVVVGDRPWAEMSEALGGHAEALEGRYVFAGEAHESVPSRRCDLEDLVEPAVYERFVQVAYGKDLKDKNLEFDSGVERLTDRSQTALERVGLSFLRTRPAKLVANGSERNIRAFLSNETADRFERLFEKVHAAFGSTPSVQPPAPPEAPLAPSVDESVSPAGSEATPASATAPVLPDAPTVLRGMPGADEASSEDGSDQEPATSETSSTDSSTEAGSEASSADAASADTGSETTGSEAAASDAEASDSSSSASEEGGADGEAGSEGAWGAIEFDVSGVWGKDEGPGSQGGGNKF